MNSLEEERQAILDRMESSREHYRRMLLNEPEAHVSEHHPEGRQVSHVMVYEEFPRSRAMRWMIQHPFLCATAVAAIVVAGPLRITRTAMKGGKAAGAVARRSPSKIEAIARLAMAAASIAQQISARRSRY